MDSADIPKTAAFVAMAPVLAYYSLFHECRPELPRPELTCQMLAIWEFPTFVVQAAIAGAVGWAVGKVITASRYKDKG